MINIRKLKWCEGYKGKTHSTNKESPCTEMLPVVGWSLKTLRGEWPLYSLNDQGKKRNLLPDAVSKAQASPLYIILILTVLFGDRA